ncbi:hypothetical protein AV530_006240 [Patagioenas fasciata monilis]|uniref:Uncharacterized protein n=1 Tax=Patagioenas fasciata monilis TaxID=372326 RepID=A0A1V4KFU9_PATFA|nr:hypothetical protein AV530_006240 [Patagioenas fasciata monilis]
MDQALPCLCPCLGAFAQVLLWGSADWRATSMQILLAKQNVESSTLYQDRKANRIKIKICHLHIFLMTEEPQVVFLKKDIMKVWKTSQFGVVCISPPVPAYTSRGDSSSSVTPINANPRLVVS